MNEQRPPFHGVGPWPRRRRRAPVSRWLPWWARPNCRAGPRLLLALTLAAGSWLGPGRATPAARAAEGLPNLQRTPIPLSPQPWHVPSQEVINQNRAHLTRPAKKELLRNGGFELGTEKNPKHPNGWQRHYWGRKGNRPAVAARAVVRSSKHRHQGRYALQINAAFGDDDGNQFSANQRLPVREIKGRKIRYSLWSYLETHPHPDMEPVAMRVRQWRGTSVIQQDRISIVSALGRWQKDELVLKILEDAEKVDVTASVANTHYSNRPTVVFLDDVSVTLTEEKLLTVALPVPEQAKEAGALPIECRIADELRGHEPFSVTHLVQKGSERIGGVRVSRSQMVIRSLISLGALQPGSYELITVLTIPELGSVESVRNSFLVYDGPFRQAQ